MNYSIPKILPIIPLPIGQVLFPSLVISIHIARKDSINLLKHVMNEAESSSGKLILIACAPIKSKLNSTEDSINGKEIIKSFAKPEIENIHEFATAARIIKLERLTSGGFVAVCQGLERIHIDSYTKSGDPFFEGKITIHSSVDKPSADEITDSTIAHLSSVATSLLTTLSVTSPLPSLITKRLQELIVELNQNTAPSFIDSIIGSIPAFSDGLTFEDKLLILSTADSVQRIEKGITIMVKLEELLAIKKRVEIRILLQQMAAIKSELEVLGTKIGKKKEFKQLKGKVGKNDGAKNDENDEEDADEDDEGDDIAKLELKSREKKWPDEIKKVFSKELKRLKKTPPQGAEYGVIYNYLDWLLVLPWSQSTSLPLSKEFISSAKAQLDLDHFGLEKVKKRLIEWLAVLRLKQEQDAFDNKPVSTSKSPILLLVGPPGVGKTSIAKSLASALGRKYFRISLGGVRDAADLRGFRKTYVGSLPGAIAMALKQTGCNNPVILLDEIDKLSTYGGGGGGNMGDPAGALLEILDPEQNTHFNDHYLGVPLDLSNVLFIATANSLESISGPLYDRMETIELSGYVASHHEEKLRIARSYLIPKQLKANSLPSTLVNFSDDVLLSIITSYTQEAGVRALEREIGAVLRFKAVEFSEARDNSSFTDIPIATIDIKTLGYIPNVTQEDLIKILGIEKYGSEEMDKQSIIGVSTGLAYRGSGNGGILNIESTSFPGSGGLKLTGQLGEVISESAILGLAWLKSNAQLLGIDPGIFKTLDIHIHIPSGGVKKDGPSAGVAMVVAMVSLLREIKVKESLAMTGEITLRGGVAPVGGIKEKLLGAHRAGIRTLILPSRNVKDVTADLPDSIKEDLTIIYVKTIFQALEAAFGDVLYVDTIKKSNIIKRIEGIDSRL